MHRYVCILLNIITGFIIGWTLDAEKVIEFVIQYGRLLGASTRRPLFKLTFDHRVNHQVDEVLLGIIPLNLNLQVFSQKTQSLVE